MKLRDFVNQLEIDPRKLKEYALNPSSATGGADKAVLFRQCLGFTQSNYEPLLEQIADQALDAEATVGRLNKHGQRYSVDLLIFGIQGQQEIVRTGWIVAPGRAVARLTTLYILRRRKG